MSQCICQAVEKAASEAFLLFWKFVFLDLLKDFTDV